MESAQSILSPYQLGFLEVRGKSITESSNRRGAFIRLIGEMLIVPTAVLSVWWLPTAGGNRFQYLTFE